MESNKLVNTIFYLFMITSLGFGAMQGGPFVVPAAFVTSGGGEKSSGEIYVMGNSTIGGVITGNMQGGPYTISSGEEPALLSPIARDTVNNAFAYPVPFIPSKGHTVITFMNLTEQATIRIYTLSGELVKTIHKFSNESDITWDVRNDSGSNLASGIYFFVIEGEGETKKGKLAVIR